MMTPDEVRDFGRHFASSPLYSHLIPYIAREPSLMETLNRIAHVPQVNLLLGAVHYLLLGGRRDVTLARFYATLSVDPEAPVSAGRPFADFVMAHADEIVELGSTRYTQTNEVRRCTTLLPGIAAAVGGRRFHLVDVGTSAGLTLAFDRYRYQYDGVSWGSGDLMLGCELRGGRPHLPERFEVMSRHGLDLNIVDPTDPDDRRWLQALVWPEHRARFLRLERALEIAAGVPLNQIEGDALETLPQVLDALPPGDEVVVMHSFALNQFAPSDRERLAVILDNGRTGRLLHRVGLEYWTDGHPWAELRVDDGSLERSLAWAHPHGEWMDLA